MVKIDLITGFLGSGKTTFIKKYAKYLLEQGEKIAILENDYGAVNVDMMLLQELGDQCELEMVAGACDRECHQRRFKTKLISMGMRGYDRVLIEPSGIFDVDEFFDALHESPLDQWYEINNVIAIVDAHLEEELSKATRYVLASEIMDAGIVIVSKGKDKEERMPSLKSQINDALNEFGSRREISSLFTKEWDEWTDDDLFAISHCGYEVESMMKMYDDNHYDSLFFMNKHLDLETLKQRVHDIFNDEACGHVFRIKGFMNIDNHYIEVNATKDHCEFQDIKEGQDVIIVIGEGLSKEHIENYWQ